MFFTIIGCTKFPDLGNGYKLYIDGNSALQIVDSINTIKIKPYILDYVFDSTFILAVQRPWDSIPNIRTMKLKDAELAFENSKFKQYWILNKKDESVYSYDIINKTSKYSNVYGPYTIDEYLKKRDSLKVPQRLKLNKNNETNTTQNETQTTVLKTYIHYTFTLFRKGMGNYKIN